MRDASGPTMSDDQDFTYDGYDSMDNDFDEMDGELSDGTNPDLDTEDLDAEAMSDDGMFLDQSVVDVRRKPYEVEFRCLTVDGIEAAQQRDVSYIAGMFMMAPAEAAVLLRHYHWNKERLIENYMDAPEAVLRDAGVRADAGPSAKTLSDFMCDICYMSAADYGGQIPTMALACGHRYCVPCYTQYATQKVREEGESRRIQCMHDGCPLVVDEDTMAKLLTPDSFQRYRVLLDRTYVDDNPTLCWCPAPGCEYAIECGVTKKQLLTVVPSVQCNCGHAFCFGCSMAAHQPVICPIARLWRKKCEDDSETSNWISANTKECPKCSSTIEKNGGCNHMTCRKCKHEFCWICAGPWSEHGSSYYQCNRFDEKSGTDARDAQAKSRAALERYLHYFNRYANHEQSARLDQQLYLRIEKKMEELQHTSDLTWIEVQFLKKAADTLTECRMTLKWTYCMAYYLERNNMTELFEDNQRYVVLIDASDLERAVEELSGQLEAPMERNTIPAMRQKVTDRTCSCLTPVTAYVQKRREVR